MRTCELSDLLFEKAEKSAAITYNLMWYLTVASSDTPMGGFYAILLKKFQEHCKTVSFEM